MHDQETDKTAQEVVQDTETTDLNSSNEEFETMLNESMNNLNTSYKLGDVVEGTISSINESHIIISLGQKEDAFAELGDYLENGVLPLKVGDTIKGFIVKMIEDQITISKSLNRSHGNKVLVKEAFTKQIPIKGKVTEALKGGFSVDVLGVRAFCPASHIEIGPIEKSEAYINNTYEFSIIEFDKGNIILSRKSLLAVEQEEKKEKFFSNINVGDVVKGRITRLATFGAFVDLGGFEGLAHISELSWHHIDNASEVVSVGDTVEVKILKIDKEKISLSLKALQENPLHIAMNNLKIGDTVSAKVIRHGSFGSFVEIEKGVEALIPISLISNKRISQPSEVLTIGETIQAKVVKLDLEAMKISLTMREEVINPWEVDAVDLHQGMELTGVIESISDHGAFIKVKNSLIGLMPQSKIKRAKLNLKAENIGEEIEVRIANIDTKLQRLSLEPTNMPTLEVANTAKPERKEKQESVKPNKDFTQDNDWQKFSVNYQSVPEDNPFNEL